MEKIFISDLHLDETHPELADLFIRFLEDCIQKADALYILGDFFETWIGDDDLTYFNQHIINALKNATQKGLAIYLMHGNRDFLIGKNFLRMTGCTLLPDEFVAMIFGTPILLMHGDTLCTEDVVYLKARKKSRSFLFRTLVSFYSLKKRRAIAERYRQASKAHTRHTPLHIMDVTQAEVEDVMKKHQVQHLIHGHTHRPAIHSFILNNQPATRTVLGAWHEKGNALVCKENGSREFITVK